MASDGRDRSRRMANRIAATRTTNDRVCMLQFEQRVVGDLGSVRGGVCVNRLADLPFPYEPTRVQKELQSPTEVIPINASRRFRTFPQILGSLTNAFHILWHTV